MSFSEKAAFCRTNSQDKARVVRRKRRTRNRQDPAVKLPGVTIIVMAATNAIASAKISSPEEAHDPVLTPLDLFLSQQQSLTAVERFSQHHNAHHNGTHEDSFDSLIPFTLPGEDEQFGFRVSLDSCTGCKACVTACHSMNGLDEDEAWRFVGKLHGGSVLTPIQQTVTTACHHCIDPACMQGCPVKAYHKDETTGIVFHLDDQCIGCHYCTLTCPYEVPQYNKRLGIVRKCDMCKDRLAAAEAPACVQACPNEAISIQIVKKTEVTGEEPLLPLAIHTTPDSRITKPTTIFLQNKREGKKSPDLLPADHFSLRPAQNHAPLAIMLVLTQLAVGAVLIDQMLLLFTEKPDPSLGRANALVSFALGVVALGASTLHLGRPLHAYRAVLGLRHSWISREILIFGGFAALAAAFAAARWFEAEGFDIAERAATPLGPLTAFVGMVGVYASAMIYIVTRRKWWKFSITGSKFLLTTLACGISTILASSLLLAAALNDVSLSETTQDIARPLAGILPLVMAGKLVLEASIFLHHRDQDISELRRTAILLSRDMRRWSIIRFGLGGIGGVVFPLLLLTVSSGEAPENETAVGLSVIIILAVLGGELIERVQFFLASSAPRMPGGLP